MLSAHLSLPAVLGEPLPLMGVIRPGECDYQACPRFVASLRGGSNRISFGYSCAPQRDLGEQPSLFAHQERSLRIAPLR